VDAPALPAGHEDRPVLVALSGGLDSTVLLHLLAHRPRIRESGLRALHVHHGLHVDADAWANRCRRYCDGLGVALELRRVRVERAGEGLEAAARRARHEAFAELLREDEVLALAHHRDDQAETFLLRALRGSGPDGLAAMRAWRRHARGWLWRPLLDVPREALLAYARANGLEWVDDPANLDPAFDRNFLRHRVLPLLRERWPHAGDALARAASLQAEAIDLLDEEDARALALAGTLDLATLSVERLQSLPAARRARVLRRWIATLDLPPLPAEGVTRIERELLPARVDAEAKFDWSGTEVWRWRDLLHAQRAEPMLPVDWHVEWDGTRALPLPDGATLALIVATPPVGAKAVATVDAAAVEVPNSASEPIATAVAPAQRSPTFEAQVGVHARRGGERIVLPGRKHSHALKHVLQALCVPPWERRRLPLVSDVGGELLAAGDLVYSARFDAWLRARGARLRWERA
jgi:tRNA(Ile)-lysidine synthase